MGFAEHQSAGQDLDQGDGLIDRPVEPQDITNGGTGWGWASGPGAFPLLGLLPE